MKILHLVGGELTGGAARGAYWLHKALRETKYSSYVLTSSRLSFNDESVISTTRTRLGRVRNFFNKTSDNLAPMVYRNRMRRIFSCGFFGCDLVAWDIFNQADVIHLHWICEGFLNLRQFSKIDKPIVWTLRDMWPFTGGCHYTLECKNYTKGCGYCPQLSSKTKYDLSRWVLYRKKECFNSHNTAIVGISEWISDRARESSLFCDFNIQTIFNAIDCNEFKPIDKQVARNILGVEHNVKIILVGAQYLSDFYKGFSECLSALNQLEVDNEFVVYFFGNLLLSELRNVKFKYRYIGFLNDIFSLRLAYSAADVFVAPSKVEAFGKTIAESMACGTPTVAFNYSGPREIIDHKKNGYLATPYSEKELANGIKWIIEHSSYEDLSINAVEKVRNKFDTSVIAYQYTKIYDQLLK